MGSHCTSGFCSVKTKDGKSKKDKGSDSDNANNGNLCNSADVKNTTSTNIFGLSIIRKNNSKNADDLREKALAAYKLNDFYDKSIEDVLTSLETVTAGYKKGDEKPLDHLTWLTPITKNFLNLCLKEFRYYFSLHCLEENVFLFLSLFLISQDDPKKNLALKKEKENVILFMLNRFKMVNTATNGDFKQFLGELAKFFAIMTIIFIFIPVLKIETTATEDDLRESQKSMASMLKKANPGFTENNTENIFISYISSYDLKKKLELDDMYVRLENQDYVNICNRIVEAYNPLQLLEIVLNYEYYQRSSPNDG